MEIPKSAKKIRGSVDHWVDRDGSIYCIDGRFRHGKKVIKKVQKKVYGYMYCGIRYPDRVITKRVHRIVAEAFLPNPGHLDIVGHKNNIKSDNRVENLYWTTIAENTQKAFDDGLIVNASGFADNQSMPVNMYSTTTNELIGSYGSASEAARMTGINKVTILNQAKYKRPVRRPYYFRFPDDDCCTESVVAMIDYDTDEIVKVFVNASHVRRETGLKENTIRGQIKNGKPKHKFSQYYFKKISNDKREQTIESPKGK